MLPGFNKGFQDRSTIGKRKSNFSYRGRSCSSCSPNHKAGGTCPFLPPSPAFLPVSVSAEFRSSELQNNKAAPNPQTDVDVRANLISIHGNNWLSYDIPSYILKVDFSEKFGWMAVKHSTTFQQQLPRTRRNINTFVNLLQRSSLTLELYICTSDRVTLEFLN